MARRELLTTDDLRVIRDSLCYSVQRVSDYPHMKAEDKQHSLRPLVATLEKVRALIANNKKEATDGR